jgi:8-oxo-dGTP pyrophosphatase MutT (NUDIX family)
MEYTVTFLFDDSLDNVLMLKKNRGPYAGTLNGVGGKVEHDEKAIHRSASREIAEETGILIPATELRFLMVTTFATGVTLHVYTGIIRWDAPKQLESEEILWIPTKDIIQTPVEDPTLAGDGNIPYFVNVAYKTLTGVNTPSIKGHT